MPLSRRVRQAFCKKREPIVRREPETLSVKCLSRVVVDRGWPSCVLVPTQEPSKTHQRCCSRSAATTTIPTATLSANATLGSRRNKMSPRTVPLLTPPAPLSIDRYVSSCCCSGSQVYMNEYDDLVHVPDTSIASSSDDVHCQLGTTCPASSDCGTGSTRVNVSAAEAAGVL